MALLISFSFFAHQKVRRTKPGKEQQLVPPKVGKSINLTATKEIGAKRNEAT